MLDKEKDKIGKEHTIQALRESPVGDVLVDEHLLSFLVAEADESHEIHVVYPGEQLDLGLELERPLHGSFLSSLDRDDFPGRERRLVNLIDHSSMESTLRILERTRFVTWP